MHDLLRLYARQVPDDTPGEREQAVGRLLGWYLRRGQTADKHLRALAGSSVPAGYGVMYVLDDDVSCTWERLVMRRGTVSREVDTSLSPHSC